MKIMKLHITEIGSLPYVVTETDNPLSGEKVALFVGTEEHGDIVLVFPPDVMDHLAHTLCHPEEGHT